jgi:Cu+-exporting ATPase
MTIAGERADSRYNEVAVASPTGQTRDPVCGSANKGVIYTCPMHPQIRQAEPGNCPICGMALEPVRATGDTGPSAELIDMTRRFWIGAALAQCRQ